MTRNIDASSLGIDQGEMEKALEVRAASAPKPKDKRWRRIYTVVPRAWEIRLLQARHIGTYRLALELLYRRWQDAQNPYSAGEPLIVSSEVSDAVNLSLKSKRRALAELEQLELIKVARKAGKAPRVVLRHLPQLK